MGEATRRGPRWRWTLAVAAGTTVALWLLAVTSANSPAWPYAMQLGVVGAGVAAGLLARRAIDPVAAALGYVAWLGGMTMVSALHRGVPLENVWQVLGITLLPATFVAIVGLVGFGFGNLVQRLGVRATAARLGLVVVAYAGLAAGYVAVADRETSADTYRLADDRRLILTVTGGSGTWCRVTDLRETDAEVVVRAACVALHLWPGTAVGVPTHLPVTLARPLGDRRVTNANAAVVRQDPPPVTGVSEAAAVTLAERALEAERPGLRPGMTKVLDLFLDVGPDGRRAFRVHVIVVAYPVPTTGLPPGPDGLWLWIDAETGAVTIISRD